MSRAARLTWLYFVADTLSSIRTPAYAIPALAFPTLLFLFFGVPNAGNEATARFYLGSYTAFAVLGVTVFQFGVGLATERESPWEQYVRILPVASYVRFAGRVLAAMLFSAVAVALVLIVGELITPAHLTGPIVARTLLALVGGGVAFTLMGLAIGYLLQARAAVAVANVLYLVLAFVGGLWLPPQFLPAFVQQISPFTPTRSYGDLVRAATQGAGWNATDWLVLAAFAVLFSAVAMLAYRRDEGTRYT